MVYEKSHLKYFDIVGGHVFYSAGNAERKINPLGQLCNKIQFSLLLRNTLSLVYLDSLDSILM